MNWLINAMKNHWTFHFFGKKKRNGFQEAVSRALDNLTEQKDLEAFGKAMNKYEKQEDFCGSPEFWQSFRAEGEWANHAQYYYFLETVEEKEKYLIQLMSSSA